MKQDDDEYTTKVFILQVPLNERGEWELMHVRPDLPNCRVRWLTERECDLLFPLFDEYNERFDVIIDYFESEIIPADRIAEALDMARRRLDGAADPDERSGLETLIGQLETALEHHTFMCTNFGG